MLKIIPKKQFNLKKQYKNKEFIERKNLLKFDRYNFC